MSRCPPSIRPLSSRLIACALLASVGGIGLTAPLLSSPTASFRSVLALTTEGTSDPARALQRADLASGAAQSADGPTGELAFSDRVADGSTDLFIMTADGSGRRALLESPDFGESEADWSPDGRQLAFSAPAIEDDRGLFVLEPSTDTVFAISDGPVDREPDWSPRGDWIAFTRQTQLGGVIQSSALALVRPDGADQRILTLLEGNARVIHNPSWGPDGQRLVFELRQEASGGADLYRVAFDGTGLRRILAHPGWDDIDPTWSPDGRRIAFASGPFTVASARSHHAIWLYDLETGVLGSLVEDAARDLRRPAWSPDGRWLAFDATDAGGRSSLHVIPSVGGEARLLGAGFEADWRPEAGGLATPTPATAQPTPTDNGLATPAKTSTALVEPTILPIPTFAPFPTFPPPEPTEPGPGPTFPPPSPTPTASPSPSPTPSPSPPVTDTPPGPPPVYLPLLLLNEVWLETSTPTPMPSETPEAPVTAEPPAEPSDEPTITATAEPSQTPPAQSRWQPRTVTPEKVRSWTLRFGSAGR